MQRAEYNWAETDSEQTIEAVIAAYKSGSRGVSFDEPAHERFCSFLESQGAPTDGADVAHRFMFADSFKGQLVLPFIHTVEAYPGSLPGPAQGRGDCESHSVKNAVLQTVATEVASGTPDEKSGKVERLPEISTDGIRNGAFSTEIPYWYRGHGGDGWHVSGAAEVLLRYAGACLRKKYPELEVDVTRYSAKIAGKYGSRRPPRNVIDITDDHLIRSAVPVNSREQRRDFLGKGFGLATDGGESYDDTRDANGVVDRTREGWAHAMAEMAFDDRPSTHKIYGDSLELIQNSWGRGWISGSRDIRDSARYVPDHKRELWESIDLVNKTTGNLMIPHGSFWARSRDVERRRIMAFSGACGWERRNLPDWSPGLR